MARGADALESRLAEARLRGCRGGERDNGQADRKQSCQQHHGSVESQNTYSHRKAVPAVIMRNVNSLWSAREN